MWIPIPVIIWNELLLINMQIVYGNPISFSTNVFVTH